MARPYRFAGTAALIAGGVHLLQFVVLGIAPTLEEPMFPEAARAGDNYWFGLAGCLTFTLVAIAYLGFFSAATALTRTSGTHDPIWRTAMQSAAVIGTGCWLLAGATQLARRGFNATAVDAASGGDAAIGRAVLQGAYITTSTAAIASALAFAVWFVVFAVRGWRAQVFGWGVATIAVVAGVVPVVGWMLDLGGIPIAIVAFLVIGPAFLIRAKKAATTPVVVAQ